jgi:acyl transferase domain-containing protein/thioesterase domain-containing protein/acyl carrier protein
MAGRFAGARSPSELWKKLSDGAILIAELSEDELRASGVSPTLFKRPDYIRRAGLIEDVECFDASFFGIGPRDAAVMDPQHRHFLECAWEALEDGGHSPSLFAGRIGVYAGCGMNSYMLNNLLTNSGLVASLGTFLLRHTANDKDFLSTGVSYRLNLKGPSVSVQTACSTSLVAVHLAVQSLLNGECDMALAGGSTINVPHETGYVYQPGEILSADGSCRPFDAASSGTVLTNGVAAIVLRRLQDALQDGDPIQAVIKGTAINNDGAGKVSYLAPSVDGHASVIAEALAVADVSAETIQYFEAHGTGTSVGDPIEFTAITQAYRLSTDRRGYCHLGSVKANIGHTDTAAGAASIIKVVEALKHRVLPPIANYTKPNPALNLMDTPLVLSATAKPWEVNNSPRRAGVSSLGVGGTNAHVILEEAPPAAPSEPGREWQTLLLSAKTEDALHNSTQRLVGHLRHDPGIDLADVAYTLQVGRTPFDYRLALAASSPLSAADLLESGDSKRVFKAIASGAEASVAFMFPGGASQYPDMGRALYDSEPVFRRELDRCFALLDGDLSLRLRELLFPENECDAANELARMSYALPAIFMTGYAQAKLLMSWGIQPTALSGHSLGEYTAACIAGVFSLEDALTLVVTRGQLLERVAEGAMLSVPLTLQEIQPLLNDEISLAVINSPSLCVVSGTSEAIQRFEKKLLRDEIEGRRLKISAAAHSHLLDPILEEFRTVVEKVQFYPPNIPFVSNLTGTWITSEQAQDPTYWVRHLRQTVRFSEGLEKLLDAPNRILLEVGPGQTLSNLARQQIQESQAAIPTMRTSNEEGDDCELLMTALGRMWLAGAQLDWGRIHGTARRRVQLPTYPFARERHWIEPGNAGKVSSELPIRQPNLSDWFYRPAWKQADLPTPLEDKDNLRWLIFEDQCGLSAVISSLLSVEGQSVVKVRPGPIFRKLAEQTYEIDPARQVDYEILFADLAQAGLAPDRIIHAWSTSNPSPDTRCDLEQSQRLGFDSLLYIAKATGELELDQPMHMVIVSNGMQQVLDEPITNPEKALVLGPSRVIPREFPNLTCQSVDIALPNLPQSKQVASGRQNEWSHVADLVIREARRAGTDPVVAFRAGRRWTQDYEPEHFAASTFEEGNGPVERGVYLITGGLGTLGLVLARHLAKKYAARLVLVNRSGLPPRNEWELLVQRGKLPEATRQQIRTIKEIESLGAEVMVHAADISDVNQVERLIEAIQCQFGTLDGVYHAAGVLEDGLIGFKSDEQVARVLLPKVKGTVVLDAALQTLGPRFIALFSSTSALLGSEGQVDYTAANAFLDAFAASKAGSVAPRYVSINWGVWSSQMAVHSVNQPNGLRPIRTLDHPMLGQYYSDGNGSRMLSGQASPAGQWVLDEHRLTSGISLMPGSAYVDLAVAAARQLGATGSVEVRDLYFVAPLTTRDSHSLEFDVRLTDQATAWSFEVVSRNGGEVHAMGQLALGSPLEDVLHRDIAAIATRCGEPRLLNRGLASYTKQADFIQFGPRWQGLSRISFSKDEALAEIDLPDAFQGDLQGFEVHPSLFDLATGFALPLTDGYTTKADPFVPMGIQRVRVLSPIPGKLFSHATLSRPAGPGDEVVSFNLELMDESGTVVCQVDSFSMRRLHGTEASRFGAEVERTLEPGQATDRDSQSPLLRLGETEGILPAEGMIALDQILTAWELPSAVVSSLALPVLRDLVSKSRVGSETDSSMMRPEMMTTFEPPRDSIESMLVELWQEFLGIERVGIKDDFFELGGHSLIAVRVFARVKKVYGLELPLAILFQFPTVEQLADFVRVELGRTLPSPPVSGTPTSDAETRITSNWSSLVPIQPDGSRPPLFCVHGKAGNVLNFRDVAFRLGKDQPFYGLQARGLNGRDLPHESIEEMAESYLDEIRKVQPHGPYNLIGYSGGGIVACEMARSLRNAGETVEFLALLETMAPWLINKTIFQKLLGFLTGVSQGGTDFTSRFLRGKIDFWRKGRAIEHETAASLETIDLGDAFTSVCARYKLGKVNQPILLIRASERPELGYVPTDLGWQRHVEAGIEVVHVPGGHESMMVEPYSRAVAFALRSGMDRRTGNRQ